MHLIIRWDFGRDGVIRRFYRRKLFNGIDAAFNVSNRGEVFVKFADIVAADVAEQIF